MITDSIRAKLRQLSLRLEEIDQTLASPEIANDMNRLRDLSQERAEIEPVVIKAKEMKSVEDDLAVAEEMLNDPEMKEFAQEEIRAQNEKLETLEHGLQLLLLPKDPNDERNIFLEIRAGTGGDESALFAGDLLRMYLRYAERAGWQNEIVSSNTSELVATKK